MNLKLVEAVREDRQRQREQETMGWKTRLLSGKQTWSRSRRGVVCVGLEGCV